MNNSTKYIIYTLYSIFNLGFPLLSMKLTNGFSGDVKFFVAIFILLIMTFANVIFHYWYSRYDFLKSYEVGNMILSVMPKFNFKAVALSMQIELMVMAVGFLIFAYGFSNSNMMIMVIGLSAWWFSFDRITDKAVKLFKERLVLVIQQIKE